MQVKVLQHHIDEGTPKRAQACAIALALKEMLPEGSKVTVAGAITVNDVAISLTPPDAVAFIRRFDDGDPVEPFTFDLPGLTEEQCR